MKTLLVIFLLIAGAGIYITLICMLQVKVIRAQAATIARQELVIDSLRNPVDTTEFLVEHSELKGD